MKKKIVKYEIDLSNPPALTPEQKTELKALRLRPDSEIHYKRYSAIAGGFPEEGDAEPVLPADQNLNHCAH